MPAVVDTIQSITEDPAVIKTVTCVVSQFLISAHGLIPGADVETSLQVVFFLNSPDYGLDPQSLVKLPF